MENLKRYSNINTYTYLILFIMASSSAAAAATYRPPAVKGAYYPSWTPNLPPSAINTTLFTHIFYAFLTPSNVTFKFEISNSTAEALVNFTSVVRFGHAPAKTLFSVGGEGSGRAFARLAAEPVSRGTFICSCVEVARKFGFDGVDLDWEYPTNPYEMSLLGLLMKELRSSLDDEARVTARPRLLLTAAVYFSADFFLAEPLVSYPAVSMARSLDWINVMSYDYNGAWSNITGPNSALFDPTSNVNTVYGLKSWARAGMPYSKMVMGVPLYGRTWQFPGPSAGTGFGATAVGPGPGKGVLSIAEVDDLVSQNGANVTYDAATVSVYTSVGSSWITFDNAFTVTAKIGFGQALGLRGYFFWALSFEKDWDISTQASRSWILE